MRKYLFGLAFFCMCVVLNAQSYSSSDEMLQIELDYKFEEETVFMPEFGFLLSPFNPGKNVLYREIKGNTLVLYNFPTYDFIKKSQLSDEKLLSLESIWYVEKKELTNPVKIRAKIRASKEKMVNIENIELRLVYYVDEKAGKDISPEMIKYEVITIPFKYEP